MLGVGVIGAGRHGERYIRHLLARDIPGAELRAFWRRRTFEGARLSSETGARFESDMDALIRASDVDVVFAAVPVALHLDIARRVANARKSLLLEKPVAATVREAEEITAIFERSQGLLTIAQTLRFDPLIVELRDRLRERYEARDELRGFAFEQRIEPRGLAWEDDPLVARGGVLLQTGIHAIDALRFVTNASAIELCAVQLTRTVYEHHEDQALLLLDLHSPLAGHHPIAGTLATSKIGEARTVRFTIHHATRTVEVDLIARTLVEIEGRERRVFVIAEQPTIVRLASRFIAAVNGEGPNPVAPEEAIAALQVVENAYQRRPR